MQSDIVIFRGPSISIEEAQKHLNNATYLPPAMQGDMYQAYKKYKPRIIGLIDGNFERIPSPWHKEILYLLSQNIKIFGAASMGALRAAELDNFGMIGVGEIYHDYTHGVIEDDDEVAILHSPQELGYKPLSDAMVDIRKTLQKAENETIISSELKVKLNYFYKNCFYKERFYDTGIRHFAKDYKSETNGLRKWLPFNKIEQKKEDAISLLKTVQLDQYTNNKKFEFENTIYWHNLKVAIDKKLSAST